MEQFDLAGMLGRTRAGMLTAQTNNFAVTDVKRDLDMLGKDSQYRYLEAYCSAVTRAYVELNGLQTQGKEGLDETR